MYPYGLYSSQSDTTNLQRSKIKTINQEIEKRKEYNGYRKWTRIKTDVLEKEIKKVRR
jgi:hypothetical protein